MFSISETYNNSTDAIMFWKASRQKKSCFVRNNADKVVGMDLITAHTMEHSRLNLHNESTQTTGLSSVDTTSNLK